MIGQTVSHYRILEPLGEGGMGTVYLAEDTHLGRRVAIKFPSINVINADSRDHRARFLREARAASELNHPSIATLFDYGETDEGRPFLVMELAQGKQLTEVLRHGELTLPRIIGIVSKVAKALASAHARGVVHRDIKPSNIMIDEQWQVKVLDFGLAKQLIKDNELASAPEAPTLLSTETRSGVVLGTPAYLSPEQAMGASVDGRSDLFALGVVLYECITGRTPFAGANFIEIAANVLHVEPTAPSKINNQLPKELDFITLKALAKKPEKRYQSAKEFVQDLSALRDQLEEDSGQTLIRRTSPSVVAAHTKTLTNLSQILQRPRIPISYMLIGVAAIVVCGLVAWRWWRPQPHQPPAEAQHWYDVGTAALRDGAYFQATKALERAVAADEGYMLAHARLAEALVELDYADRAKDELLRVTGADRSTLSGSDLLYLDAITATARHDFSKSVELYNQIVAQATDEEKPHVFVDLGHAYEKNEAPENAIKAYQEASNRNPQYATPFLRLGILYGRRQELPSALASFDKAENIYQALGNLEGRAEVFFQRGALYNKLSKLADAKAQLQQALALARANDNASQEIKALLQLSSVNVDTGETAQATEYAREAVELAQKHGMENLSARGLVDLGNAFLIRGEYTDAEKYLTQAIESAQRAKARGNEARARVSLASLRQQQNNPAEVIRYVEPALEFYRQGGYRSETSSCLALLARANKQKGDYEAALKVDAQILQLGQQWNDQAQIALGHAEIGAVLVRQEKYSEALDHFSQAFVLYTAQGVQRSIGFNLLTRAYILFQLGHYQEAQELLDQGSAIADKPAGGFKNLSVELKLVAAEMALSQDRFPEAKSKAEQVLEMAGSQYPDLATEAKRVLGSALSSSGRAAAGKELVNDAVEMAKSLNDPAQLATAQLALAETMLKAGDSQGALKIAQEAHQVFSKGGLEASEWRAGLVSAIASRNLGDTAKFREYALQATESLTKLEQRWGRDNYNSYLSRPDVQRLQKELTQLTSAN
jgi:serine/threonine protein kinase/Tfp pilus assembly protein PilF